MSADELSLAYVIETLSGRQPEGLDQPLSAVVVDSRKAGPGVLFIALKGERTDGHEPLGREPLRGFIEQRHGMPDT